MKLNDQELILDYLHGREPVDELRLNELLRDEADARAFLRQAAATEVRLRELALVEAGGQATLKTKAFISWRHPLAWAASVALTAVATWLWWPSSSVSQPQVARLISATNARWDDSTTELRLNSGDEPSERLRLAEGRAEFLTAHGATVILDGPAEVQFVEAGSLLVVSGRVMCRCPTPESRLVVRTAQTEVIDLGTEFAVEARDDRSTRVAVLSGEVKVASTVLKQGQGVEVRTKGVTVLSPEMLAEMQRSFKADLPMDSPRSNRLIDGSFEASSAQKTWELPVAFAKVEDGGLRISARGHQAWPNARQGIWQSDLAGRVVTLTVKAKQPSDDGLVESQFAVLKLTFVGERGVEFAYASRHFQFAGDPLDVPQEAQVAAIAPPGTKGVSVQLLLNAHGEKHGSVIFDDAVLTIGEVHPITSPSK